MIKKKIINFDIVEDRYDHPHIQVFFRWKQFNKRFYKENVDHEFIKIPDYIPKVQCFSYARKYIRKLEKEIIGNKEK